MASLRKYSSQEGRRARFGGAVRFAFVVFLGSMGFRVRFAIAGPLVWDGIGQPSRPHFAPPAARLEVPPAGRKLNGQLAPVGPLDPFEPRGLKDRMDPVDPACRRGWIRWVDSVTKGRGAQEKEFLRSRGFRGEGFLPLPGGARRVPLPLTLPPERANHSVRDERRTGVSQSNRGL